MQQVLEAIKSAFTKTAPEYAALPEEQDAALDHICRTNPFLLAYSS